MGLSAYPRKQGGSFLLTEARLEIIGPYIFCRNRFLLVTS